MNPKRFPLRRGWVAAIAALVIVAAMVAVFALSEARKPQESIVLPQEPVSDSQSIPEQEQEEEVGFAQITKDNVLSVLQKTVSKPMAYHQSYSVTVGADESQAQRSVELWVNWPLVHGEVSDDARTKTVLSDGETAYLWYNSDQNYITVPLDSAMDVWDLLGLPSYDYLETMASYPVTDGGYLVLEDPKVQSAYVCCQDDLGNTWRYWVNLDNGLLYMADVLEHSTQVYAIRQTYLELLAQEDETFSGRFLLPDGTQPFSAETQTQQP